MSRKFLEYITDYTMYKALIFAKNIVMQYRGNSNRDQGVKKAIYTASNYYRVDPKGLEIHLANWFKDYVQSQSRGGWVYVKHDEAALVNKDAFWFSPYTYVCPVCFNVESISWNSKERKLPSQCNHCKTALGNTEGCVWF